MIPLNLIMAQPDLELVSALVAHAVAKKAGYKVFVRENRSENEVRFSIDVAGNIFEGSINRNEVAQYFGWKILTQEEILLAQWE